MPPIDVLEEKLDDKTFQLYADGMVATINQFTSDRTLNLVKKYKPKTVAEVCAFIAAIRPGFVSLLDNFVSRKPYSTGVKELDSLLEDSFHYLMYQESIMKYLVWLGIEESETYTIVKKISKKSFGEEELRELKAKLLEGWVKNVGKKDGFEKTWKVVEDSASYSFNSSHSLAYAYDSLYCMYLKAHHPLEYYSVVLNLYEDDIETTSSIVKELDYFGIKLQKVKFRYSKASYSFDKNTNTIYKGINSVKYLNAECGEKLYNLRNEELTLVELFDKTSEYLKKNQMEVLISLDFFDEFGGSTYLKRCYAEYKKMAKKKTLKKDGLMYPEELVRKYATKESEKMFRFNSEEGNPMLPLLQELFERMDKEEAEHRIVKAYNEHLYTGTLTANPENPPELVLVADIDVRNKYANVIVKQLSTGYATPCRIRSNNLKKDLKELHKNDIIKIVRVETSPKMTKGSDGRWKPTSEKIYWIDDYKRVQVI